MNEIKEKIIINEKFEQFMVPLSEEEFKQLEENILREGCKDPLIVWTKNNEKILVDGHNRFKICSRNHVNFKVDELTFENDDEVLQWIINRQMGRRNLTSDQMAFYRGFKYLHMKKKMGGYDKVISKGSTETTSEILAKEFNVSSATIRRDASFAQGVELVGKSNPGLKMEILQGLTKIPKKDIQFLASVKDDNPKFKNEADLYNKLVIWKNDALNKIESKLEKAIEEDEDVNKAELFPDYEARVKRIKSLIVTYMNNAIEKKNLDSIRKLREIIDQLEAMISE